MLKQFLYFVLIISFSNLFYSCKDGKADEKSKPFPVRDYSINKTTAYNQRFLDSAEVELFIKNEKPDSVAARNLRAFYNSRNYQYAWFDENSLNEQGVSFWNLVSSFIHLSKDSSLFNRKLDQRITEFIADSVLSVDPKILAQTDLALTQQFFVYAQTAYAGKLEPSDLQWFIPRKKIDALALLDSLIARKGSNIEVWEPVNPLFQSLRKKLSLYNEIADKGGWNQIQVVKGKPFKPGDSSNVILQLKKRLAASGDYATSDTSNRYDSSLLSSVKKVETSLGLKADGLIDTILIKELNVPVKARIEQMLVNLERMRWLPEQPSPDRIVANIPEFVIHVFENNKNVLDMDIVVGKEGTGTVIFNDKLKYIVFSPYWNVPRSIVKNEIAPAMARNRNYLASHNMEITGTSGGLPVIRQLPGGSNSLGKVKFLFPNNYNIYFHDTPAKSLFSKEKRAFSHGCIRLSNAEKMANYLLRNDTAWTPEKIKEAMNLKKEKWVTLKNEIPVFISYFTAWVDENGLLNFRDDIYGHDRRMAEHLFMQPVLATDSAKVLQQ